MSTRTFYTVGHYYGLFIAYVGINLLVGQRWILGGALAVVGAGDWYLCGAGLERINEQERGRMNLATDRVIPFDAMDSESGEPHAAPNNRKAGREDEVAIP